MPKRFVDGEALWLSDRVKSLPEDLRLHYANWIPLAEANGVFEADPERILSRVYSFLLPDIGTKDVLRALRALIRVGLVKTWRENGKTWGYFIGIAKGGRLPPPSQLEKFGKLPPSPPFADDGSDSGAGLE
jgi:hypothetical protein